MTVKPKHVPFRGDEDYLSVSDKAALIERARKNRKALTGTPVFKYPGFQGEPSQLPGMKKA
jgi:hypothetical protein